MTVPSFKKTSSSVRGGTEEKKGTRAREENCLGGIKRTTGGRKISYLKRTGKSLLNKERMEPGRAKTKLEEKDMFTGIQWLEDCLLGAGEKGTIFRSAQTKNQTRTLV